MLDLFNPPKPPKPHASRKVLLLDAWGQINPDKGLLKQPRPSKFEGWTREEYLAYRRSVQNARYAARKAARK